MVKNRRKISKETLYFKVLSVALKLEFERGHLAWSMTELAKESKISRPTIYYYFGNSKKKILLEAITAFGDEVTGQTPEHIKLWKSGNFSESFNVAKRFIDTIPGIIPFYFIHRGLTSSIGKEIKKIEQAHQDKISKFFPELNDIEVDAACAMLTGLIFAPTKSAEVVSYGAELLLKSIIKK